MATVSTPPNGATFLSTYDSTVDMLVFRRRLEEMADRIQAWQPHIQLERAFVKETILRAYEFQRSVDTLKELVKEERVSSDPILSRMFQYEIDTKEPVTKAILELPPSLLTFFEVNLIKLVKYQLEHNEKEILYLPVPDKEFCRWLSDQRMRINRYLENPKTKTRTGAALQVLQQDIILLERLNVKFRVTSRPKTFEDWVQELRDHKAKHGHIKVRQKMEDKVTMNPLGEWVKRIRREYVQLQQDPTTKVPNLTAARIVELSDLGMIWQIRYGRPKKGDERYRLRRSSVTKYGRPLTAGNNNNSGTDNEDNNNNTDDGGNHEEPKAKKKKSNSYRSDPQSASSNQDRRTGDNHRDRHTENDNYYAGHNMDDGIDDGTGFGIRKEREVLPA